MAYPTNCIRGIPNQQFIAGEDLVASHLFYFHERDANELGWIEQSINWEDDEQVVHFTLRQRNPRRPDERQFRAGVAIIPRTKLDELISNPHINGHLDYERKPLADNPYHGNLLLNQEVVDKPLMKMIAAALALAVRKIVLQPRA